jgi:hypothetical protein
VAVIIMPSQCVIETLANNPWSFEGWGKDNANSLLVQAFINKRCCVADFRTPCIKGSTYWIFRLGAFLKRNRLLHSGLESKIRLAR